MLLKIFNAASMYQLESRWCLQNICKYHKQWPRKVLFVNTCNMCRFISFCRPSYINYVLANFLPWWPQCTLSIIINSFSFKCSVRLSEPKITQSYKLWLSLWHELWYGILLLDYQFSRIFLVHSYTYYVRIAKTLKCETLHLQ